MDRELFSSLEFDTIGEIMNISMGSAATAVSTLLDSRVDITTPKAELVDAIDFQFASLEPAIGVEIKYIKGISGNNFMILKKQDIKMILAKLMSMDPDDFVEFDEIAISAICEIMNQMMGSAATALSMFLGRTIDISTPQAITEESSKLAGRIMGNKQNIVVVHFNLSIEGIMNSEFMSVLDIDLAREIVDIALGFAGKTNDPAPVADPTPPPPPQQQMPPPPQQQMPPYPQQQMPPYPQQQMPPYPQQQMPPYPQQQMPPYPQQQMPPYPQQQMPPYPQQQMPPYPQQQYAPYPQQQYAPPPPVNVKRYNYEDIGGMGPELSGSNMDLIMTVPLQVTVELGRARKKIKDIIELGQGSIIELDKQAGTQVDVMVNGQLVARGDVVVVDDNFSVRITEILQRDLMNYI